MTDKSIIEEWEKYIRDEEKGLLKAVLLGKDIEPDYYETRGSSEIDPHLREKTLGCYEPDELIAFIKQQLTLAEKRGYAEGFHAHIPVSSDEAINMVEEIKKSHEEGIKQGSAYKGKAVREAYQRGFREGEEKAFSAIIQEVDSAYESFTIDEAIGKIIIKLRSLKQFKDKDCSCRCHKPCPALLKANEEILCLCLPTECEHCQDKKGK